MHRGRPYRLAIIASHPIQYHAHWFRSLALHAKLDIHVLFGHNSTASDQGRAGFNMDFDWDVPLLHGYSHHFLTNVARHAGPGHFWGIKTPEIGSIIRRGRYNAVLLLGWQHASDWQAISACWNSRTPLLVRGDSNLLMVRPLLKRALKRVLHGSFIPRFSACLAVGTRSELYYRHYGARRVFRVPHSIDPDLFRPGESDAVRIRARETLGLPPDATIFLFAGKLVDQKRPMDFVNSIPVTSTQGPHIHGLVVGDGPLKAQLEKHALRRNAPIKFIGFKNQTEMPQVYHAADALVLPSDGRETWGLVVNEAMASGLPCIVSDQVGCAPDLVVGGTTGDTFPLGAVEKLQDLITRYASNPSALRDMGECANRHEACYSQKAAVEGVIAALDAVVHE